MLLVVWKWIRSLFWKPNARFSALAGDVLEKKKKCAPGTYALARHIVPRLTSHFGGYWITEIGEAEWSSYIVARQAKLPGCTFFDDKKYMTMILRLAEQRRYIDRRPFLRMPDAKGSVGREILPVEVKKLLRAAGAELKFMIELALKMGLRRGELLGLKWTDFDWERRMVRIVSRKTGRPRDVPLNADLYPKCRKRMFNAQSDQVFPSRYDLNKAKRDHKTAWQACKRRAKVRCRWADLRITCATWMLRRGASMSATAKILGNSEKIVREWYERLGPSDLHRASATMRDRRRRGRTRAKPRRPLPLETSLAQ